MDGSVSTQHSRCAQHGWRIAARVVDHIRSIAQGGAVFDPTNHQSLCVSCNTRKG
jgi:5-methylcytosine-specific restriction endonuclease McrA